MTLFVDWEIRAKRIVTDPYNVTEKRIHHESEVTDEIIEDCYITMAQIVKDHGDVYLPIFERFHKEREKRIQTKKLLEQALSLSH